jgi:hypothetical protein
METVLYSFVCLFIRSKSGKNLNIQKYSNSGNGNAASTLHKFYENSDGHIQERSGIFPNLFVV